MSNSKLNQPLPYGQSVVDADFSAMDYSTCPSFDENQTCMMSCQAGWLPAPDGCSYRCPCNVLVPDEVAA